MFIGVNVFFVGFSQFLVRGAKIPLFMGVAFLGADLIDLPHAIRFAQHVRTAEAALLDTPAWYASRLFLALLLLIAARERGEGGTPRRFAAIVLAAALGATVVIDAALYFAEGYLELAASAARMFGLFAGTAGAVLFLVALVGFVRKFGEHEDPIYQWAAFSLVLAIMTQVYFVGFERAYDAVFNWSYWLKALSYSVFLFGLLASYVDLYRREVDAYERELRLAGEVQRQFLPARRLRAGDLELAARQEQAHVVGGDWYDHHREDSRLLVSIGDASGKGMFAALLATVAQGSIRASYRPGIGLDEVAATANREVLANFRREHFATLLLLEIQTPNVLRYVNCGHEWPAAYHPAVGDWAFMTGTSTVPLGISTAQFKPAVNQMVLFGGSKIVLFTDGLKDARSDDGEMFGLERILDYLRTHTDESVDRLCSGIIEEARLFAGGSINDDITVVALGLRGR